MKENMNFRDVSMPNVNSLYIFCQPTDFSVRPMKVFAKKLFLIFHLNSGEVLSVSANAVPAVLIVVQIVFNDKSFGLVQLEEFKTKPLVEILGCKSWRMEKTGYLLL